MGKSYKRNDGRYLSAEQIVVDSVGTTLPEALEEMQVVISKDGSMIANSAAGMTQNYSNYRVRNNVGVLTINCRSTTPGFTANAYTNLYTINPAPAAEATTTVLDAGGVVCNIEVATNGIVRVFPYGSVKSTGYVRASLALAL